MSFDNQIIEKLIEIETELKRFDIDISEYEKVVPDGAFGGSVMPFEVWLVKIFIPNVLTAAAKISYPLTSQVGIAALRNFDGDTEKDRLVELLFEFDQLINNHSGYEDFR